VGGYLLLLLLQKALLLHEVLKYGINVTTATVYNLDMRMKSLVAMLIDSLVTAIIHNRHYANELVN
jgi:hypothetical protein